MNSVSPNLRPSWRSSRRKSLLAVTLVWMSALALCLVSQVCAADSLDRREWKVDGVTREALLHIPAAAKTNPAPVVFAFHGHGGTMQRAAQMFRYHTLWPQAVVVYMQGLNTPGRLTDPEGKKPGWQSRIGDQSNRDLKFFDAVLATLQRECAVDAKRIYAAGHSNGGLFTYLLWSARGERLAAFGPSGAIAPDLVAGRALEPRPVLHTAGRKDALVKFQWQQRTIEAVRKNNQCEEGQPLGHGEALQVYKSRLDAPVVTFIHPGGHEFPRQAAEFNVKFFRKHARP